MFVLVPVLARFEGPRTVRKTKMSVRMSRERWAERRHAARGVGTVRRLPADDAV